ncbi:MAG: FABP family protein [Euzebyaceae bacterium]|jgi:hypothetical protein|nr:FABP family protein [Euzebyaceae bacterium]
MTAALHPQVAALAFLLGTWEGEGTGEYPTIEGFGYREQVSFCHNGKPMLAYTQQTWHAGDGRSLHAEAGYFRGFGDTRVEVVLAHPTGVVEVYAGEVFATSLRLRTSTVVGTPTAKPVEALERDIDVDGDTLRYAIRMAAVGQPLTHHLAAELHRVRPTADSPVATR